VKQVKAGTIEEGMTVFINDEESLVTDVYRYDHQTIRIETVDGSIDIDWDDDIFIIESPNTKLEESE
jgi:hypothetical protein